MARFISYVQARLLFERRKSGAINTNIMNLAFFLRIKIEVSGAGAMHMHGIRESSQTFHSPSQVHTQVRVRRMYEISRSTYKE